MPVGRDIVPARVVLSDLFGVSQQTPRRRSDGACMTLTTIAVANGVLAVLVLTALTAVIRLGLRVDRSSNAGSIVPAASTTHELADAA
jgi:hypothetical protein